MYTGSFCKQLSLQSCRRKQEKIAVYRVLFCLNNFFTNSSVCSTKTFLFVETSNLVNGHHRCIKHCHVLRFLKDISLAEHATKSFKGKESGMSFSCTAATILALSQRTICLWRMEIVALANSKWNAKALKELCRRSRTLKTLAKLTKLSFPIQGCPLRAPGCLRQLTFAFRWSDTLTIFK